MERANAHTGPNQTERGVFDMAEDLVMLSRRIAKAKPNTDACPLDEEHHETGLPQDLFPFSIIPERGEDTRPTGTWRVIVASKQGNGHAPLYEGCPNVFDAYRKMVDCLEAWQIIKPVEQVYFIGTELVGGCLIKVGFSRDPAARLRALQTAHGHPLQIFATVPGGKDLEAKYHRRWRARRCRGEWFTIGQCIIDEIERLNPSAHAGGA